MQLGFVIDHSRCIGCHACTVACKSENDVPVGNFRTWVKYTEKGSFPDVRRSFAVLRCNQCSEAPCVTICPVGALDKRTDGIVDVDPNLCIGCKACMQGCPYDALYLNEGKGTVEKCHFCAHRVEQGLAPACAVVCPTEAIIPGDFDDPSSRVSRLGKEHHLTARKTEVGTGPNVLYREVAEAGIDPLLPQAADSYLWAERLPGVKLDAATFDSLERKAEARTVYDVDHPPMWGAAVSAYLFTKSLAAGALLAGLPLLPPAVAGDGKLAAWPAGLALAFLALTAMLLVGDLKRPERFLYILLHPNWSSWLTKGTLVLAAYGILAAGWLGLAWAGVDPPLAIGRTLAFLTVIAAALTACYTAWLFGQAKGRVLWLRRWLAVELIVHAWLAGAALLLLCLPLVGGPPALLASLSKTLGVSLVLHLVFALTESLRGPEGRTAEYKRAVRLISHGPFARRHWIGGVLIGGLVPLVALLASDQPWVWALASAAALLGLWIEQDVLVRAGQAPTIS